MPAITIHLKPQTNCSKLSNSLRRARRTGCSRHGLPRTQAKTQQPKQLTGWVLSKDANSAPAQAGLAHVLIAEKHYADAEDTLRSALKQAPDDPALNAQLAMVLAAQDKAEALPLLQKMHADHPDDAAITRMLAAVLGDAGDYAGADKLYVDLLGRLRTILQFCLGTDGT